MNDRINKARMRLKQVAMGITTFTLLASYSFKPDLSQENNGTKKQTASAMIKKANSNTSEEVNSSDTTLIADMVAALKEHKPIPHSKVEKLAEFVEQNHNLEMGPDNYVYAPESIEENAVEMSPNSSDLSIRQMVGLELMLMKYPDGGSLLDASYTDTVSGNHVSALSVVNASEESLAEMKRQCSSYGLDDDLTNSTRSILMSIDKNGTIVNGGFNGQGINTWQEQGGKVTKISQAKDNPATRTRSGNVMWNPRGL